MSSLHLWKPRLQEENDVTRVYHFGKKVNSTKFAKCDHSPKRKQPIHSKWSKASIPEWQKYTFGGTRGPQSSKVYVIIVMYTTSCNEVNPNRRAVDIFENVIGFLK